MQLKNLTFMLLLLTCFSWLSADEEEIIEGSKHIIALDLEARFEISGDGNEISPRDSGSGSGFNFQYQYLFGLGLDINADHAAPLFNYLQKPTFISFGIGIDSDKFEGKTVRSGSPFRVDFSKNVFDLAIEGQHYFKNGIGIEFNISDVITEGARFQIFDDATIGDTGLEKLDQNEFLIDIGINKYLLSNRLLIGLDFGFSAISGEKPFFTGKKDDGNDISGGSFNFGFQLDYLFDSEKFKVGFVYNFLTLDQDTDVTINAGARLDLSGDGLNNSDDVVTYTVFRDETAHFLSFRFKHIYKSHIAFNYIYSITMLTDDLDNELKAFLPTVEKRDITVHQLAFSPEYWVFNRMKIAFNTGFLLYDFKETGGDPVNVQGTLTEASVQKFDYVSWFAGITVDILF
ncbi:MAG: hypothetical protein COA79_24975 [Planctomycetota bacterium]|nr:MAG: hypothetical protein COA79_24975 [Planctomycetota bacterium]